MKGVRMQNADIIIYYGQNQNLSIRKFSDARGNMMQNLQLKKSDAWMLEHLFREVMSIDQGAQVHDY